MADYTKVVIEADERGRMAIWAYDDQGVGGGYRLAGPKYLGDEARVVARCELDRYDVKEIRSYLAIWDDIQARKAAAASSEDGAP